MKRSRHSQEKNGSDFGPDFCSEIRAQIDHLFA